MIESVEEIRNLFREIDDFLSKTPDLEYPII